MRTVFTNSQVCHVWAQQRQSHGRGSNIFFRDTMIFSYGEHYLMAKIHTHKGKRFALVNSRGYSVSTRKHTSYAWNALQNLMPAFASDNPECVKTALKQADAATKTAIASALKRVKVADQSSIDWELECIQRAFETANELRAILGRARIKPKASDIAAVKAHLKKRLARYRELNTPEMIAARAMESMKRAERAAAKSIEDFRSGKEAWPNLPYELLRVQGDTVRTSRGAEVPLRDAITLYRAIESGRDVLGASVGHFRVVRVVDMGTDKAIKIGCHTVLLSEARNVLGFKEVA
jgi:hypothetical protein